MPINKLDLPGALIFFHIGKTAGTTFRYILLRNYPEVASLSMLYGINPKCVDELKKLPPERRAEIKYVHAHMTPFGIHEYLPHSTYVTLLRNPLDRVISAYYHIQRERTHPLHHTLVSNNMSFQDYLTSGVATAEVQSGQTRIISGIKGVDWVTGAGPLSQDVLEQAQNNLEHYFSLVGLTERFDESLLLLKKLLGWSYFNILYRKLNVAPWRPSQKEMPQDVLEILKEYNELDLKLCQFAELKLDVLIKTYGSSFYTELRTFQLLNKLYNRLPKFPLLSGYVKQAISPRTKKWHPQSPSR